MSGKHTKKATIAETDGGNQLAPGHSKRLAAVAALPDAEINLSDPDAPEIADWSGAVRGRFYKPVKTLKSLRLDADVLAWFQAQGPGYQTRINAALRQAMLRQVRKAAAERAGGSDR